jgi:tetratricopeptide (TPR) repeat protein/transcriptional regulator with XRE-family HTH domain
VDSLSYSFSHLLRGHRQAADLTQEELAAKSGLSVRAVTNMERGRTARPYRRSVALLAKALELPEDDATTLLLSARGLISPALSAKSQLTITSFEHGRRQPVPRQLPASVRHFVGRTAELAELTKLLDDSAGGRSAVVISAIGGMAGVGKTALAVFWGHQIACRYPDGQLYVNLRGFDPSDEPTSPAAALRGFLTALGIPPGQIPADLDAQGSLYRSLLAERSMLVVLDNARDSQQVRPLLPGGPSCLAIVTSRNRLTGLIASAECYPVCLDVLDEPESMELLSRRLGASSVQAELEPVKELARMCGGLPLALGIAAAQSAQRATTAVATITSEIKAHQVPLDSLETGDLATSPRVVFSWSYRLLTESAARLFRLLSLHPGADISDAAAASLCGNSVNQTRHLLGELLGAGLLAEPHPGRFGFHDLLRAYAIELASAQDSADERDRAIQRVLTWYLHTAAGAARLIDPRRVHVDLDAPRSWCEPLSLGSYDGALSWLESERANLVLAIATASQLGVHEIAWKLPISMWELFCLRGYWYEWIHVVETGLASARHINDELAQALLLNHLAIANFQSGNVDSSIELFRQTLGIWQANGDRQGSAMALCNLGRAYGQSGKLPESMVCLSEALALILEVGGQHDRARCLLLVSATYRRMGRLNDALESAQQSMSIARDIGNEQDESSALVEVAHVRLTMGKPTEAIAQVSRAAELSRRLGDRRTEAEALSILGHALYSTGKPVRAWQCHRDAYAIFTDVRDPRAAELLGLIESPPPASSQAGVRQGEQASLDTGD